MLLTGATPFYAQEGYFDATTKEELTTRYKDVWQLFSLQYLTTNDFNFK